MSAERGEGRRKPPSLNTPLAERVIATASQSVRASVCLSDRDVEVS